MTYEIVRGSVRHIRPMARRMRAAGAVALQSLGADPRRAFHDVVLGSRYCRTALSEGVPIAMWGIHGAIMASEAEVWLVLSDDAARIPISVVREARASLKEILASYARVTTVVIPDDEASVRFALYLGFCAAGEAEGRVGGHRARARRILSDPQLKVPVGDGFVVALTYGGD